LFTDPDAGVVTLADNVGEAVVDGDLDVDIRILRQEPGKFRQQDDVGSIVRSRYANGSGGFAAQFIRPC
jgi:hypothetical protein